MDCTLCGESGCRAFQTTVKPQAYFHCPTCDLRFLDPNLHPSRDVERARYLLHQNDPSDPGYQQFLEPLYLELTKRLKKNAHILDFGAGPGPALIQRLREMGYTNTALYDPYFWPDRSVLDFRYDAISASEVIEHFRRPAEEFKRLSESLDPNGIWLFMTHFYHDGIDFNTWYYRGDSTHLSFYSVKTMQWVQKHFSFLLLEFPSERVCVLTK